MKIDFTKVVLKGLDGKPIIIKGKSEVYKTIANAIYFNARSIDLCDIASLINKGGEVEMSESQLREVKNLISGKYSGVAAFAQRTINEYINKKLSVIERKKAKKKNNNG